MAATVNRTRRRGRGDSASTATTRRSARRAWRGDEPPTVDPGVEVELDDLDEDEELAASPKDGATYLSMYFHDMAALDVLRPREEFESARAIEDLEVSLWQVMLGHAPGVELVLAAAESAGALPAEASALRQAQSRIHGAPPQPAAWTQRVTSAARALQAADADRVLVEAALGAVRRSTPSAASPRAAAAPDPARAHREWLRRVRSSSVAAADARNAFVKANLRLVVSIARRYNHGRMALADLIQEGNLGLMKAVERYDYRRGFRFSTYASWWIRHAIGRALADKGREVRLPVHVIDAQHRLAKARRRLMGELGRQPTSAELAAETHMSVDKIEKMRRWLLEQSISIDGSADDEDGPLLGEVLADPDRETGSPTDELAREAMAAGIQEVLGELAPIEADVLRQRFGIGTDQELTLKQIGERYNLSRERIRQLQEQALTKMRRALARRDLA